MYKFGDILVINFPFTDGKGSKRRPVLVLKETADDDILIIKITSKIYSTEYDVKISDWQNSGLLSSSVIRTHKMQTIHNSLVFAYIGQLNSLDKRSTKNALTNFIMSL
ncbi:MAG TPA: type II toxin-antitoxin system PemK/MazF family toxin [Parafilimonas sp.]